MKRVRFNKYAGVKIRGTVDMVLDSDRDSTVSHAEAAAWLTAQVESNGKYGCVMNYDGNGSVLASREHRRADKPGDLNLDGIVDHDDINELLEDWLK